jgi:hypothetical protein
LRRRATSSYQKTLILPIQCTEKNPMSTYEIRRLRAPIFWTVLTWLTTPLRSPSHLRAVSPTTRYH